MELLFQHANSVSDLTQIIVIADAASNTIAEMEKNRRNYRGEAYWAPRFLLRDSEMEIHELKKKHIPIHSYYIGDRQYFEKISKDTKGDCEHFDIHAANSAERLAKFIASKILTKIGG